jgi:hypothetical protein
VSSEDGHEVGVGEEVVVAALDGQVLQAMYRRVLLQLTRVTVDLVLAEQACLEPSDQIRNFRVQPRSLPALELGHIDRRYTLALSPLVRHSEVTDPSAFCRTPEQIASWTSIAKIRPAVPMSTTTTLVESASSLADRAVEGTLPDSTNTQASAAYFFAHSAWLNPGCRRWLGYLARIKPLLITSSRYLGADVASADSPRS